MSREQAATRREFLARGAQTVAVAALGTVVSPGGTAQTSAPAGGVVRRVIIDTDPGVDDALAIFLALRSPELHVEALTPVAGNVPLELTLPNALRLLEVAGRTDIPVATGADRPLTRRLITAAYAHGENGLGGVQFPEPKTRALAESGAQMIRRIVRSSPGEISILALGPLTNLALAFRQDPALPRMVRSIALMGGSLSRGNVTPSAEFNIYVDPEAAQEVFHAGIPIIMVGLDVTRKATLREEHIKALEGAGNAIAEAAGRITRSTWNRMRRNNPNAAVGPAMHDSVAIATFIDETVCTLQDHYIEVETAGEFTAGETLGYTRAPIRRSAPPAQGAARPEPAEFKPNARVAMEIDAEKFFNMLVGRLTRPRG